MDSTVASIRIPSRFGNIREAIRTHQIKSPYYLDLSDRANAMTSYVYATLMVRRALPNANVITCEFMESYADVVHRIDSLLSSIPLSKQKTVVLMFGYDWSVAITGSKEFPPEMSKGKRYMNVSPVTVITYDPVTCTYAKYHERFVSKRLVEMLTVKINVEA